MTTRPTLRSLLLWPLLLTLALGAAGLGIFVERSVRGDLFSTIDTELDRAAIAVGNRRPGEPERVAPEASDEDAPPVQLIVRPDGSVEPASRTGNPFTAEQIDAVLQTTGTQTLDGTPRYRARADRGADGTSVITALSLEPVDQSLSSLRRNLVVGVLSLIAVQSLVLWLIASKIARPVTQLSEVTRAIADGELDTPIGSGDGPAETVALAADLERMVDRLRAMIDENERSAQVATAARDDMQRFMADASHELRTPLTALKGYTELYESGMLEDDADLDRAMSRIGSESERMRRLVVDMLDLMRSRSVTDTVDVRAVAGAVADDLRAAYPNRSIQFDSGSTGLLNAGQLNIVGNAQEVHQALLNLGANACEHTPEATSVRVSVLRGENEAVVTVADDGDGVPAELAERIFVPFFRGDESRSRRSHDGAGLGLAIVSQVAERHGGSVSVSETPGGGATFEVRFPTAA